MNSYLTSLLAAMSLMVGSAVSLNAAINLDINDGGSATQSGFTGVTLSDLQGGFGINGATITLAGAFDDRIRTDPDNGGSFTFADLYRDFVFLNGNANLSIVGLLADTEYTLGVYSYDNNSTRAPARSASYFQGGDLVLTTTPFQGANSSAPLASNDEFLTSGTFTTDSNGAAALDIVDLVGSDAGVFINGLELAAIPEPSTTLLILSGVFVGVAVLRHRLR